MKVLVIDNEPNLRTAIKALLNAFCPEITVIEDADGVRTGLQKIKSFHPDIVLLDVEMDDGSGFDLMKQVAHPSFQLIFVTAHNKYAIEAFQFSAIDYLLKPVDPDALQKSIQKAIHNIQSKDLSRQIEFLLHQLNGKHDHDKRIVLKDIDNIYFVRISDILYCLAEGTYTKFYIQNSNPVMVSKNLKEYENILEPLGFIRTHHSYLVNPSKIIRFDKSDGGSLILEDNHSVPLSQRKKEWVLTLLEGKN
ncbi:MAG: response regulator transcription factor [Chitinophagaceae bacterium]|nr:response regulator transcription factor [Chitinophagaceae bacterium]